MDGKLAVEGITEELRQNEEVLYGFMPEGEDGQFFIESAAIGAAAAAIAFAFLKGVVKGLTDSSEDVGESLGKWLVEKLGGLFHSKKPEVDQADVDKELAKANGAIAGRDADSVRLVVEDASRAIKVVLESHGAPAQQADDIIKRLQQLFVPAATA